MLGDQPGFEVVGCESRSGRVVERCRRLAPDVVLLDVEMPGESGIELARQMRRLDPAPAVIFVTAHEDYAVDAFGLAAVDYLVKPVRPDRLRDALGRVSAGRSERDSLFLPARVGDRLLRIPLDRVRALTAEDKCTLVHHVEGQAQAEASLKQVEQELGRYFVRVHRNALVSRAHLLALFRDRQGTERVKLEGTELRPEVSRRNRTAVKRVLNPTYNEREG